MGVDEGEDKGERGEKRNEEHGDTVKVRVNTNVLQLAVQFNSLGNHQTEPYKKSFIIVRMYANYPDQILKCPWVYYQLWLVSDQLSRATDGGVTKSPSAIPAHCGLNNTCKLYVPAGRSMISTVTLGFD